VRKTALEGTVRRRKKNRELGGRNDVEREIERGGEGVRKIGKLKSRTCSDPTLASFHGSRGIREENEQQRKAIATKRREKVGKRGDKLKLRGKRSSKKRRRSEIACRGLLKK